MSTSTTAPHQTSIPFSDPPWLLGLPSPYYTPSHRAWQKSCRAFVTHHLGQHALQWETEESVPEHVFGDFCAHNMLVPNLPAPLPVEMLKSCGIHDVLGVKVEEWDYTHTAIYSAEVRYIHTYAMARGCGGNEV